MHLTRNQNEASLPTDEKGLFDKPAEASPNKFVDNNVVDTSQKASSKSLRNASQALGGRRATEAPNVVGDNNFRNASHASGGRRATEAPNVVGDNNFRNASQASGGRRATEAPNVVGDNNFRNASQASDGRRATEAPNVVGDNNFRNASHASDGRSATEVPNVVGDNNFRNASHASDGRSATEVPNVVGDNNFRNASQASGGRRATEAPNVVGDNNFRNASQASDGRRATEVPKSMDGKNTVNFFHSTVADNGNVSARQPTIKFPNTEKADKLNGRNAHWEGFTNSKNFQIHALPPWDPVSGNDIPKHQFNSAKPRLRPILQRSFIRSRLWLISTLLTLGIGLLGFSALVGSLYFFPTLYLSKDPLVYLARIYTSKPNRLLDRNGKLVAELFSSKMGHLKSYEIPKSMERIIIFIEDQHFYQHAGIHWPSVARAAFYNLISFKYTQGGSTITQQLARLLLLEKQKTITRKIREGALAYFLERNFSKEEILTAYLNLVYLGHGAYGVEHASQFYFQKDISQLSFAQQLMLACLPSAPEYYSPLRHPQHLEAKMQFVYKRMLEENFPVKSITEEELKVNLYGLSRSPLENVYGNRVDHAPYVTEYIRQKLATILGKEYMYNAGLTIQTSLDLNLQQMSSKESKAFIAERSQIFPTITLRKTKVDAKTRKKHLLQQEFENQLPLGFMGVSMYERPKPRLQTASVGIENQTGNILFLQGGHQFGVNNQFNRAIHMYRQTGSIIKPILYALALEKGIIRTNTLLDDRPIFEKRQPLRHTKDYWSPTNYSGVYEGAISVRRALVYSQNLPAIYVAQLLG